MPIESSITPYPSLNQLSLQYSIFGFLLRNITKPGNHFAARCYLSALDDTNSLPPGQVFNLLTVLDYYHETESDRLNEERSDRVKSGSSKGEKRLYVPVTRKVSAVYRNSFSF